MKKYFVLIFVLCFSHSFAQTQQEKAYFSILFNDTEPLGQFRNTGSISNSGFAKASPSVDFSFNYKIYKHFGFASMMRYQTNTFNSNAFAKAYAGDSSGNGNAYPYSGTMQLSSWSNLNLMGGAYYLLSFDKSEKFSIETRAMFGIQNSYRPEINIENTPPYNNNLGNGIFLGDRQINYSHKSTLAFTYLVGLGCRYNLTSKVSLFMRVDYSSSNPTFKNIIATEVYTDNAGYKHTYSSTQNYTMKMSSLNIGFGMGMRLFGSAGSK